MPHGAMRLCGNSTLSFVLLAMLVSSSAQAQAVQSTAQVPVTASAPNGPILEDGTPIKLKINETLSSADAKVGQTVDFEVLEEVRVGNLLVIPKGGTAWATVTDAKPKGHMGKGGKLDVNIDSVRLVDGEKTALRAVKEAKGGGHTGAMTAAMVGTAIVFFPAAPLFLFIKGKDITIPKGTEITAYVEGNCPIDVAKFQSSSTGVVVAAGSATELDLSSNPAGAEVSIDGSFVGNTPSSFNMAPGDHTVSIKMAGYESWDRTIHTSGGKVNLAATLVKGDVNAAPSLADGPTSLADAARAAKAKQAAGQNGPQN